LRLDHLRRPESGSRSGPRRPDPDPQHFADNVKIFSHFQIILFGQQKLILQIILRKGELLFKIFKMYLVPIFLNGNLLRNRGTLKCKAKENPPNQDQKIM
jgi:hypothetical protein